MEVDDVRGETKTRARLKIVAVAVGALLIAALVGPAITSANAAVITGGAKVSAEDMTGSGAVVADPLADGGKAVELGGNRAVGNFARGTYSLSVRVSGKNARVLVRVGGGRVAEQNIGQNLWQTITMPVYINGYWDQIDVSNVAPGPWEANAPVRLDYIQLTPDSTPTYTTKGNQILDPSGKPFTPRGLQPLEIASRPLTDADADAIRDWGANTVRLVVAPQKWLSTMCGYDPNFQSVVDDAVNKVTSRGMVALLELSHSTNGNPCGDPQMRQMADALSIQFWTEVATRYKNNPSVMFDLYNEPNNIPESVWRFGGNVTAPDGTTFRATGMQQLINVVRITAGARNPVYVSGLGYAYDIRVAQRELLSGYGIILASHVYCLDCGGALRPDINDVIPPVAASYPVVISEFGWDKWGGVYQKNLTDWAEAHHVGWMSFQFTPWAPTAFGLFDHYGSYQPNVAGNPIRNALWAARGWTTPGGR